MVVTVFSLPLYVISTGMKNLILKDKIFFCQETGTGLSDQEKSDKEDDRQIFPAELTA